MKINLTPIELIDQLRSWFHPKDRVVVMPTTLTAAILSGASTLAMALIDEKALTASAANITFSSIPQTFRSLFLTLQLRTNAVAEVDGVLLRFNGDIGGNYDRQVLRANSVTVSGVSSRAATSINIGLCEATNSRANNFSLGQASLLNYSLTNMEKQIISTSAIFGDVSADTDIFLEFQSGRWRSTASIMAITILSSTGSSFVSGSRATLYGLL